ncbi:MAG: hypothetical protein AB7O96_07475 [Pseudobdellovibrionaceae bacterium]
MLRKIVLIMLMMFTASVCHSKALAGDDGFWPWGERVDFPWQEIQGQWIAENNLYTTLFNFSVTRIEDSGERILNVVQLNPHKPNQILARGVGYETDKKIVRAMMKIEDTSSHYRIYVHAYTKKEKPTDQVGPGEVIKVLSISLVCPISADDVVHLVLSKVSSRVVKANKVSLKNFDFKKYEREVLSATCGVR